MSSDDRYLVISADCHGGGNITDYRPYLPSRWHDDFDAWAAAYEIPYEDMKGPDGDRNWPFEPALRQQRQSVCLQLGHAWPSRLLPTVPNA